MRQFIVNDQLINGKHLPGTVALDFIRNTLKLTGTKEGCKEGECGACTVLLGELQNDCSIRYKAVASCLLPIGSLNGKHLVTVEGLNFKEGLNAVQHCIFDNNASQCGFCTPGIVLSLTGFLLNSNKFSYNDAVDALDGNICRCTGYYSIKNAAKELSNKFIKSKTRLNERVNFLVENKVLPDYFKEIPKRLKKIEKEIETSEDAELVAGGTDLLVQKPDVLLNKKLVFLSDYEDLHYIKESEKNVIIGAAITVEEMRNSEIINKYFSSIKEDLLLVSSMIMRNKATLTGNIVNASPIGDLTILLLALDAELLLEKNGIERNVLLKEFYKGYKKFDLKCREIIKEIRIPIPKGDYKFSFEKVSNRKYLDIASCNSAMMIELKGEKITKINISVGGVAPVPLLLNLPYLEIIEKNITLEKIEEIIVQIKNEITPIDDIRGTAKYKKILAGQLVKTHFLKFFQEELACREEGI